MGSSCAHYQNKLETKKKYLTTLLERIHGENSKKTKNLEKTTKKQYLETLWESSIDKIKKTSRKPKNQKTKTFQRMFGLRLMFGFFWFCLGFFVFFSLDLEKTKKTQGFFGFLDNWWLKNCEKQKNSRFFFLGVCGFSFFLAALQ